MEETELAEARAALSAMTEERQQWQLRTEARLAKEQESRYRERQERDTRMLDEKLLKAAETKYKNQMEAMREQYATELKNLREQIELEQQRYRALEESREEQKEDIAQLAAEKRRMGFMLEWTDKNKLYLSQYKIVLKYLACKMFIQRWRVRGLVCSMMARMSAFVSELARLEEEYQASEQSSTATMSSSSNSSASASAASPSTPSTAGRGGRAGKHRPLAPAIKQQMEMRAWCENARKLAADAKKVHVERLFLHMDDVDLILRHWLSDCQARESRAKSVANGFFERSSALAAELSDAKTTIRALQDECKELRQRLATNGLHQSQHQHQTPHHQSQQHGPHVINGPAQLAEHKAASSAASKMRAAGSPSSSVRQLKSGGSNANAATATTPVKPKSAASGAGNNSNASASASATPRIINGPSEPEHHQQQSASDASAAGDQQTVSPRTQRFHTRRARPSRSKNAAGEASDQQQQQAQSSVSLLARSSDQDEANLLVERIRDRLHASVRRRALSLNDLHRLLDSLQPGSDGNLPVISSPSSAIASPTRAELKLFETLSRSLGSDGNANASSPSAASASANVSPRRTATAAAAANSNAAPSSSSKSTLTPRLPSLAFSRDVLTAYFGQPEAPPPRKLSDRSRTMSNSSSRGRGGRGKRGAACKVGAKAAANGAAATAASDESKTAAEDGAKEKAASQAANESTAAAVAPSTSEQTDASAGAAPAADATAQPSSYAGAAPAS